MEAHTRIKKLPKVVSYPVGLFSKKPTGPQMLFFSMRKYPLLQVSCLKDV